MEEHCESDNTLSQRLLGDSPTQREVEDDIAGEIIVDPLHAGMEPISLNQESHYKDIPFAIGFVFHFVTILFFAVFWGAFSLKQEEDGTAGGDSDSETLSLWGFCFLLFFVSTSAAAIAAATLDFMTQHAEQLMQASLLASCIILGAVVFLLFANGAPTFGFCWLFVLICTGLYAYSVQHRLPFACANLRTAVSAVQSNYGVCIVSYAISVTASVWVIIWLLAVLGVAFRSSSTCDDGVCQMHMNVIAAFLLLLSFYWTSQVLKVRRLRMLLLSSCDIIADCTLTSMCTVLAECCACHSERCYWYLVVCTPRSTERFFASDNRFFH